MQGMHIDPAGSRPCDMRSLNGYTLVEVVLVVAIFGIFATVLLPDSRATDESRLDMAANEVAAALRYAQSEALRTAIPHGAFTDDSTNQIKVYNKPSSTPVYDVYHPVDRKLYDIKLENSPLMSGVDFVSAIFNFSGPFSSSSYLGFNIHGHPKYTDSGTDYMLIDGNIILAHAGKQRVISIAPMTGRVTVQ